ncbi:hypothetical protein MJD09_10050 [bacterium]|nr:hypothetical protein [bacterium]
MEEAKLNILHDHYKESFSYIRQREKQRDRLFLIIIALLGLLGFQILYPTGLAETIEKITIGGAELEIAALPLSAVLSTVWTFTLAIVLRYCSATINVERQYKYLHSLEETIADILGKDGVYQREGRRYKENYPIFSKWAWFFYTILFPLIAIYATVLLLGTEIAELDNPIQLKIFDGIIAAGIVASLILYRIKKRDSKSS